MKNKDLHNSSKTRMRSRISIDELPKMLTGAKPHKVNESLSLTDSEVDEILRKAAEESGVFRWATPSDLMSPIKQRQETEAEIRAILRASISDNYAIPVHYTNPNKLFFRYQKIFLEMLRDPKNSIQEKERLAAYGGITGLIFEVKPEKIKKNSTK